MKSLTFLKNETISGKLYSVWQSKPATHVENRVIVLASNPNVPKTIIFTTGSDVTRFVFEGKKENE